MDAIHAPPSRLGTRNTAITFMDLSTSASPTGNGGDGYNGGEI